MNEKQFDRRNFVPTLEDEEQFQVDIEPWLDSLIERHGVGRMTKLPYDPGNYPFQKITEAIIRPPIPSAEQIEAIGGRAVVQAFALEKIRAKGYEAVGEENYNAVVQAMLEHNDGKTLYQILSELTQAGGGVKELLAHANLQDIPFTQLATADALSQAAAAHPEFGVDLLDLIDQSYSYASETMSRLEWDGKHPVIEILSGTANAVKLYPPTESGSKLPVNPLMKRFINHRTNNALRLENERLSAIGRSRLDYVAPTGTTMEKVKDGDKLIGLRPKKMNQVMGRQIVADGSLIWPIAYWFEGNGGQLDLKFDLLQPHRVSSPEELTQTMQELYQTTADLANAKLLPTIENSIGGVAVQPE